MDMSCLGRYISLSLIEPFFQIKGTRLPNLVFMKGSTAYKAFYKNVACRREPQNCFFFASVDCSNCLCNVCYSFSAVLLLSDQLSSSEKPLIHHWVYHGVPNLTTFFWISTRNITELMYIFDKGKTNIVVRILSIATTEIVFYFRRIKTSHKTNSCP
jgi:hypothetical protein